MNRAARVLAWWRDPRQWSALALVVVLLLALPPLRALLEASMSSHMLVQMPLAPSCAMRCAAAPDGLRIRSLMMLVSSR